MSAYETKQYYYRRQRSRHRRQRRPNVLAEAFGFLVAVMVAFGLVLMLATSRP